MELNLRKARKLEQELEKHISSNSPEQTIDVRVNGDSKELLETIEAAKSDLHDKFIKTADLINLRFKIRNAIGKANHTAGIFDLMNEKAEIEQHLKTFKTVSPTTVFKKDIFLDHLIHKRKVADSGAHSYGNTTEFSVSCVSEEFLEHAQENTYKLKKKIAEIEEDINTKNVTTKITLSGDDSKLLLSEKLI